eukprot:8885577-Heterocapsa_arctica.AAC.1
MLRASRTAARLAIWARPDPLRPRCLRLPPPPVEGTSPSYSVLKLGITSLRSSLPLRRVTPLLCLRRTSVRPARIDVPSPSTAKPLAVAKGGW